MAKNSIQGYVELASGLGEITRSRAKEAAREIVALASHDTSRKKLAKQASDLADELLTAAEANRKHLVRLVRREVDTAVGKLDVDRLTHEVQGLGATVAALASQVEEMARGAAGVDVRGAAAVVASRTTAKKAPAKKATTTTTTAAKKAPAKKATTTTTTAAKKAPAKKATTTTTTAAKKAPARKAPAKRTTATSAAVPAATAASTPAASTPAASTPAASTPAASTPAASTALRDGTAGGE